MNSTVAAVVAKTESAWSLHPYLMGALIALGGALLAGSGLRGTRSA